jgi:hypothetical protein
MTTETVDHLGGEGLEYADDMSGPGNGGALDVSDTPYSSRTWR